MTLGSGLRTPRGSAHLALPLLLLAAGPLAAAGMLAPFGQLSPPNHIDAGTRYQAAAADALDSAPRRLGLPVTGAQWILYGGGVTLSKPDLRFQGSAWTGGLSAESGGSATRWDLQLAELALEQTYIQGSFLITGGVVGDYAGLHGLLTGPGGHSSVTAPLWGGGVTAGLRWPRTTKLAFFVRSGYVWLVGQGDWRGDQAASLGSQRFDLSGLGMTAQLELEF